MHIMIGIGVSTGSASPAVPVNTVAPVIDSDEIITSPHVGDDAFVKSVGTWTGTPTSYTYQWQRNPGSGFVNITSETADLYMFTSADIGSVVRCTVLAINAFGPAAQAAPSQQSGSVTP
jgi:hypothetical protein